MIINFNPSPEIKTIIKSFFSKPSLGYLWKNFNQNHSITFYSRATWALYDGIIQSLKLKDKKNGVVWFPDYFCNEALIPLRTEGISLKFYPILKNLQPDWKIIDNQIKSNGVVDVFVLVHYFGVISSNQKAIKFCKKNNIILIEDGAHLLKPIKDIGDNIYIYSPRKILSLPEIGILVTNKTINSINDYKKNNIIFFKWLIKQIIKKIFSVLHINWHFFVSYENIDFKNDFILKNKFPSRISMQMIKNYENKLNLYGDIRKKNYLNFEKSITEIKNVKPLFKLLPNENIPYVFPLLILKNHSIIKNKLKNMGIPATSWPDLPPEVKELNMNHNYAIWLRKHVLLFPIHQSIKIKQIKYIVSSLKYITETLIRK